MLKFLITFSIYIKVINKYYQKHKKRLRKEAREGYQSLSEEKKKDKRPQKDAKILLKKKNKKGISIIKGHRLVIEMLGDSENVFTSLKILLL